MPTGTSNQAPTAENSADGAHVSCPVEDGCPKHLEGLTAPQLSTVPRARNARHVADTAPAAVRPHRAASTTTKPGPTARTHTNLGRNNPDRTLSCKSEPLRLGRRRIDLSDDIAPGTKVNWQTLAKLAGDRGVLEPRLRVPVSLIAGANKSKYDTGASLPPALRQAGLAPWRAGDSFILLPVSSAYITLPEPEEHHVLSDGGEDPLFTLGTGRLTEAKLLHHFLTLQVDGRSAVELLTGSRYTKYGTPSPPEYNSEVGPYRIGDICVREKHNPMSRPDVHIAWRYYGTVRSTFVEAKHETPEHPFTDMSVRQVMMPLYAAAGDPALAGHRISGALLLLSGPGEGRYYRFAPVKKGNVGRSEITGSGTFALS